MSICQALAVFVSSSLHINSALFLSPALEREGQKGSPPAGRAGLAKFDFSAGIVCFANVPCS